MNNSFNSNLEKLLYVEGWKWPLIINLVSILVVGGLGNATTLVAFPYVQWKHGKDFPIIKTSIVHLILILHLCFCDLLYCLLGFPPLIEAIYLGEFRYSATLCWWLGLVRAMAAYLDFITVAMISVCVCYYKLCKKCRLSGGTIIQHNKHDRIFGGFRIIFVISAIWISAFLTNSPAIFIDGFQWTGSMFGCDDKSHIAGFTVLLLTIMITVASHSLVAWRMLKDKNQSLKLDSEVQENLKKLSHKFIIIMTTCCSLFSLIVLPHMITSRAMEYGIMEYSDKIKAVTASIYWWIYGYGFSFYISTNKQLRNIYAQLFRDIIQCLSGPIEIKKVEVSSVTDITKRWWKTLEIYLEVINHKLNVNTHLLSC